MRNLVFKLLQRVWRRAVPQALKSRIIPHVNLFFHKRVLRKALIRVRQVGQSKGDQPICSGPLIVSAFFGESLGIGRGGHCSFDALERAGLNPIPHDLRPILNTTEPFTHRLPGDPKGGVHFIHCNAPEVLAVVRALHPDSYAHNYRIGYWAYELPKAPQDWIDTSHFFHEIWVPSEFVKSALEGAHCPVKVMPHDVMASLVPADPKYDGFGIGQDKFTILAAGDLRSSASRKNLEGSVEIYTSAFPEQADEVELIVKVSALRSDTPAFNRLQNLIGNRQDIRLFTENLEYEDLLSLMQSCDLLLSPHRSEGFGLMLAEFLAMDKAVLATGWSGNMEFMSDVPGALLPFRLVPVHDQASIYKAQGEQQWADVDIDRAADLLREVAVGKVSLDFQAARHRLQQISERWGRESLSQMTMTDWLVS